MKVIVGNKVYLQKFDMAYMIHEFSAVPGCIMAEAFSSACMVSVNGGNDAVRFGFCFEEKEAVEFLKECDWILDFSEHVQKSAEELAALRDEISGNLAREVDSFNKASLEYRKEHFAACEEKFDHMRLQAVGLDMLVDCRNGRFEMPEIPDENTVLEDNGFRRIGRGEFEGVQAEVAETPKKQGFFRRFFKRGAQ